MSCINRAGACKRFLPFLFVCVFVCEKKSLTLTITLEGYLMCVLVWQNVYFSINVKVIPQGHILQKMAIMGALISCRLSFLGTCTKHHRELRLFFGICTKQGIQIDFSLSLSCTIIHNITNCQGVVHKGNKLQ